jgi:hypothetical protein
MRNAQGEFHSTAQARAWADGDFDADHGVGLDGVGRARLIRARRAAPEGWSGGARRRLCTRLAVYKPPKKKRLTRHILQFEE